MNEKEKRIKNITRLYYSRPEIEESILKFSEGREVIARYYEFFGKRPDTILYKSDIRALVKKGATSFHASEEIWKNPLEINPEMTIEELNRLRVGWDLIMDIDSPYFDMSKALTKLIINVLEKHSIKNYGIKFSGGRGFHILVSKKAFPEVFLGKSTKEMFPDWPRAICQYLMYLIRHDYNKVAKEIMGDIDIIKKRTNLKEEQFLKSLCPKCGSPAKKGKITIFECPLCKFNIKRKDVKIRRRKLVCPQNGCAGILKIIGENDYLECERCKNVSSINKREASGRYKVIYTNEAKNDLEDFKEEFSGEVFGSSDLVLVSPRHLFRMPYSLHEKTALASVVLLKEEIDDFDQKRDAEPLRVKVRDFIKEPKKNEAIELLRKALDWKKKYDEKEEKKIINRYIEKKIDIKNINENLFPQPIKKLLNGLEDGRKRGLFILITFLRSLNFGSEYIIKKVSEWNKKNNPPLRESYIKGQLNWHLKQKRKILPPNYKNDNYYRDLGLIENIPREKNPIVEVLKKAKKRK